MKVNPHDPPPRGERHEALDVFEGEWQHNGESFGSDEQSSEDPKTKPDRWNGIASAKWITGEYFLVQDETATVGKDAFHMVSVMGVDSGTNEYFVRAFSHLGFYRHYKLARQGNAWVISGDAERARIEFSPDGDTQHISWEWLREDIWLPLCDRKAVRMK